MVSGFKLEVPIHGPTVLCESTAPCILPTTTRANSPIVFPVIWIVDASEARLTLESITLRDHKQTPLVISVWKMEDEIAHEVEIQFHSRWVLSSTLVNAVFMQSYLRDYISPLQYGVRELCWKNSLTVKSLMIPSSFFWCAEREANASVL